MLNIKLNILLKKEVCSLEFEYTAKKAYCNHCGV